MNDQRQCMAIVKAGLRYGILSRRPCVFCFADDAVAHHPTYEEPATVVWMCRPCHWGWHAAMAREREELQRAAPQ